MALGRRQRKNKATDESKIDATPPWEVRVRDEPEPTTGPFDERDAPDDDVARIDLGALRIPVQTGLDVRLEVDDAQQIVAATLARADGGMQLGVFAAPRNEGIWDEVRAELLDSLRQQRANPSETEDGPFGVELAATLPGPGGKVPVRFVGVEGPRWFLRAMFTGAAVAAPESYERALRQVIVVRGTDPLPAREAVPLVMPKDLSEQLEAGADGTEGGVG